MVEPVKYLQYDYELTKSPATFDFVDWLATAEEARKKSGYDGMIVRIVKGRRFITDRDMNIGEHRHAWREHQLLPEIAKLLPSVKFVIPSEEGEQTLPYWNLPALYTPILHAPSYALNLIPFLDDYITFSVRQSWTQIERNVSPDIWNKVLKDCPLPVIIVPDTEAEMNCVTCSITQGYHYSAAAFSPALRMALYEKARLNLFSSCGPMMLAIYSNVNAECFGLNVESQSACSLKHLTNLGMLNGRRVNNTVFHWNTDIDMIMKRIRERLEESKGDSNADKHSKR